jgi:hypothetical protein
MFFGTKKEALFGDFNFPRIPLKFQQKGFARITWDENN